MRMARCTILWRWCVGHFRWSEVGRQDGQDVLRLRLTGYVGTKGPWRAGCQCLMLISPGDLDQFEEKGTDRSLFRNDAQRGKTIMGT